MSGIRFILSIAAAMAFIAGYSVSVICGIWWPDNTVIIAALSIMGLLVGFFNIAGREIVPYLVAAIALVLIGNLGVFTPLNDVVSGLGDTANDIVFLMAVFTAPAAVVQSIRAGIILARPGG
ncbi:MAG: hypothetical protein R6U89_08635 [Dehalococcoidia bacterium]